MRKLIFNLLFKDIIKGYLDARHKMLESSILDLVDFNYNIGETVCFIRGDYSFLNASEISVIVYSGVITERKKNIKYGRIKKTYTVFVKDVSKSFELEERHLELKNERI